MFVKKNLAQKTILVKKKMILKKSLLRGLVKNMSGKKLLTPKDFGPKKLNWKNIRPKQFLGRKRK